MVYSFYNRCIYGMKCFRHFQFSYVFSQVLRRLISFCMIFSIFVQIYMYIYIFVTYFQGVDIFLIYFQGVEQINHSINQSIGV